MEGGVETYTFSADIAQLMGVMVSTVYANKEIFLRELISNASDALERRHHEDDESLSNPSEACIFIYPDVAAGTLTIEDTGIGMSRDDLVENLGTIARSKTKAFLEAATSSGADPAVIGQFGIGFYSAYVVSEKVMVVSRSMDCDDCNIWESTAGGAFTMYKDSLQEHSELWCGTKVVCFLKEDQMEYLDSAYLRQLLMRHSCFVKWPIYLRTDQSETVPYALDMTCTAARGWELITRIKPVWLQSEGTVTASEYNEVYKWLEGNEAMEALAFRHVENSGHHQVDFRALLFCAQRAASDIFDLAEGRTRGSRVRLFARRVFVKEFDDLLPKWMAFLCGVVDSDDVPLNISREQLQKETAVMRVIGKALVRQCFEMLESLACSPAKYRCFHDMFGQNLKLGVYDDAEHRARIIPLLRFYSTESGEDLVSFQEYVERMRPAQRHILYITGRSRQQAIKSPLIEGFRRDGYEVLLMTDPADEFALQVLKEFNGRELMSATTVHAAITAAEPSTKDVRRLEGLQQFASDVLRLNGTQCQVVLAQSGVAFPATIRPGADGEDTLELDGSHGLFEELAKRLVSDEGPGATERDLIVMLHEMAAAMVPSQLSENPERRRRAAEKLQDMVRRLDGAYRNADDEDLPQLPLEPLAVTRSAVATDQVQRRRTLTPQRWPCIGSLVRVVTGERSRRGIVAFMEESDGKADVLCSASYGPASTEEEHEGLLLTQLRPLLHFENPQSASPESVRSRVSSRGLSSVLSELKEQGNELFKLMDYDAALEVYTQALNAIQGHAVEPGQVALRFMTVGGCRRLASATIRRVVYSHDRTTAIIAELVEEEFAVPFTCPAAALLPVLGLHSWTPLLKRAAAFRNVSEPLVEHIAEAAADSAVDLVTLQTAILTNRARCWSLLGCDSRAAQDLTLARAAWQAFAASQQTTGPAVDAAIVKGLSTSGYLRAKARLRRGLASAAAQDIREALARRPPKAVAGQLAELQHEVLKVMGERRRVTEPLARELAKAIFALRAASL